MIYVPDPDDEVLPVASSPQGYAYRLLGSHSRPTATSSAWRSAEPATRCSCSAPTSWGATCCRGSCYGTRISLSIGLVGVALVAVPRASCSGGISGYFGGVIDTVIQRIIEFLRSIPTIPLWMGLAAALPADWPRDAGLLRHHDHPLADRLDRPGARGARQVPVAARGGFRHGGRAGRLQRSCGSSSATWCPSFLSHIIAAITLAIPAMILGETSLSFLGLGLRPPAVSWGVLLQDAQNIQALAHGARGC